MKLLALDTTMAACSVAVLEGGRIIACAYEPMERGHAEALAPMVQQVMSAAGLGFGDLDRIAVTTGPGTFTGVRIGLAMARGLGLALGIPVCGIDTLSAIAANESAEAKSILVAADARKDEVYAALLQNGKLTRQPHVAPLAEVALEVPAGTIVIGTAARAVIEASGRADLILSPSAQLPVAAKFAALAAALPTPDGMPAPLYLRDSDARPQAAPLRRAAPDIVKATRESAEVLARMHAECFDEAWTAQAFADLLAMPGAAAVIALEHAEPLGFALIRRAADEAEIITIATRPMAQRRGVARAMLDHQFTELLSSGVRQVFIEVAQSNVAARALYAALGLTETGTRRGYYERANGRREDAIVMRKDLAP